MDGDRTVIPRNGKSNWVKRCGSYEWSKIRQDKRQWSGWDTGANDFWWDSSVTWGQLQSVNWQQVAEGTRSKLTGDEQIKKGDAAGAETQEDLNIYRVEYRWRKKTPSQHRCLQHQFQLRKDGHWMIFDFILWGGWLHFRVIRQDGLNPKMSLNGR